MSTDVVSTDVASAELPLPDDLGLLKKMIAELGAMNAKLQVENAGLQQQLKSLLTRLYGPKSEKFDPNQPSLFTDLNEAKDAAPAQAPPPTPEPDDKPKRPGHGRGKANKNLRREKHVYELPETERTCPNCQVVCTKFGEETSEQLDYIPASVFVHEHIRTKYACPKCHDHVIVAQKPEAPIAKGLPGAGLLAQVATSKYADHLPLHRLERILRRQGALLSRSTMCDWMRRCADLLTPLYAVMVRRVLVSRVIHTDDTKVALQDPEQPGKTQPARLWTYLGDEAHPYNVFDFTVDWSRDGPRKFLQGFKGHLQADALSGYDTLCAELGIVHVGCWAHGRRHFHDAKDSDPVRAAEALARIGRLYAVEHEAAATIAKDKLTGAAAEQVRLSLRQEKAKPELTAICQWLKEQQPLALPKSPIGQAVQYSLNQWAALELYADTGFLAIDNNAAERALRHIAIGRKNWLFVGSEGGGRTAAVLFTMTSTCHRLRIDPFAYLRDVLNRLAGALVPADALDQLLPDRWQPPSA
jgi:transposase